MSQHDQHHEDMINNMTTLVGYDFRKMFQGYLERGFAASDKDLKKRTALLGHSPRRHEDFAKDTALEWKK